MDQIILKDLSIFAKHGLFDAEADLGQRFYIDVVIEADLTKAEKDDDAEATINWADLVEVVTRAFTERRFNLIEAAAAAIIEAAFKRFLIARSIQVEIRKPSAPIDAIFAYTSTILYRERAVSGHASTVRR